MTKKDMTLKTLDSKNGVDKCDVNGFESVVPQIRQIDVDIAELNEKRSNMKNLILNKVKDLKQSNDVNGVLYKSFVIASEDEQPAVVLFKDIFKKLDTSNEEAMRKVLNGRFDELFETTKDVKLKNGVDFEEMRKALGKNFSKFFTESKHIAFQKGFMEKRMALRKKMGKRQNALTDKWATDSQASPDLRMKG